MKILVPTLLFLISTACASNPKMTYCDLVTEEPTESYSNKTSNKSKKDSQQRSTANSRSNTKKK